MYIHTYIACRLSIGGLLREVIPVNVMQCNAMSGKPLRIKMNAYNFTKAVRSPYVRENLKYFPNVPCRNQSHQPNGIKYVVVIMFVLDEIFIYVTFLHTQYSVK